MITISHSSLESYKSMEGKHSIIWTRAIQTLKPALLSSIFSGRDNCSTRACLFFAELVRCVPIKNIANSPANLIAFNKNLHILDSRILTYTCTTQGKKEGTRQQLFSSHFMSYKPPFLLGCPIYFLLLPQMAAPEMKHLTSASCFSQ